MSQRQTFQIGEWDPETRASLYCSFSREALRQTGEASLMSMIKASLLGGHSYATLAPEIPLDIELDTIVFEYGVHGGRVDMVVFHADGSVSAIEVKDGTAGGKHVLSGIGQVGLYALDMGMSGGRPRKIRKGLFWTSTGDMELDSKIMALCEDAGVVPCPWASLKKHTDVMRSVLRELGVSA